MKRAYLSLFLAFVLVGVAHAQSQLPASDNNNFQGQITASAEIDVRTTVVQRLAVEGTQNLDFGFVTGGEEYDEIQAGVFEITGEDGATVSLNQGAVTTNLSGGTGSVVFTPGTLASSTSLTGGSALVNITGSIDVGENATGDFSGTYELEVGYTSF